MRTRMADGGRNHAPEFGIQLLPHTTLVATPKKDTHAAIKYHRYEMNPPNSNESHSNDCFGGRCHVTVYCLTFFPREYCWVVLMNVETWSLKMSPWDRKISTPKHLHISSIPIRSMGRYIYLHENHDKSPNFPLLLGYVSYNFPGSRVSINRPFQGSL